MFDRHSVIQDTAGFHMLISIQRIVEILAKIQLVLNVVDVIADRFASDARELLKML